MQTVLTLTINVTDVLEVHSQLETARLVLFDGTCEGSGFSGTILPGGVDTQRQLPDGTGCLSARYIISGTDETGAPARLFVQNNAPFGGYTTPVIRTDSRSLRWLEEARLRGSIETVDGKLTIRIEAEA